MQFSFLQVKELSMGPLLDPRGTRVEPRAPGWARPPQELDGRLLCCCHLRGDLCPLKSREPHSLQNRPLPCARGRCGL